MLKASNQSCNGKQKWRHDTTQSEPNWKKHHGWSPKSSWRWMDQIPSLKLTVCTQKSWFPIGNSFSRGVFSSATLVSGRVIFRISMFGFWSFFGEPAINETRSVLWKFVWGRGNKTWAAIKFSASSFVVLICVAHLLWNCPWDFVEGYRQNAKHKFMRKSTTVCIDMSHKMSNQVTSLSSSFVLNDMYDLLENLKHANKRRCWTSKCWMLEKHQSSLIRKTSIWSYHEVTLKPCKTYRIYIRSRFCDHSSILPSSMSTHVLHVLQAALPTIVKSFSPSEIPEVQGFVHTVKLALDKIRNLSKTTPSGMCKTLQMG